MAEGVGPLQTAPSAIGLRRVADELLEVVERDLEAALHSRGDHCVPVLLTWIPGQDP